VEGGTRRGGALGWGGEWMLPSRGKGGRETPRVERPSASRRQRDRVRLWGRKKLGFLTSSLYMFSGSDIGLVGLVSFLDGLSRPLFNRGGPCYVTASVNILTEAVAL